eukprot:TRINITY_DN10334_c0_g1_i2.p1 TRINITY_DN10334_c0_g1~~TRINITY_DN10334_c0_g1_i2.p1  ORF type:complete len:156 (-),score=29.10 TRINITY_DN10334_c0_g1_i2:35-466(-)
MCIRDRSEKNGHFWAFAIYFDLFHVAANLIILSLLTGLIWEVFTVFDRELTEKESHDIIMQVFLRQREEAAELQSSKEQTEQDKVKYTVLQTVGNLSHRNKLRLSRVGSKPNILELNDVTLKNIKDQSTVSYTHLTLPTIYSV